jgi:hypothetical protein
MIICRSIRKRAPEGSVVANVFQQRAVIQFFRFPAEWLERGRLVAQI